MSQDPNTKAAHAGGSPGHNFKPHLNPQLSKAYRQFYASLTPEQLKAIGGQPHPSNLTGEINPQLRNATSPDNWERFSDANGGALKGLAQVFMRGLATYDQAPVEADELDQAPPSHLHILQVMQLIRRVLMVFTTAPDTSTRLHGEVVAIALGFPGVSVATVSRKYGVSRQVVSKRLRKLIKDVGLPLTRRMTLKAQAMAQAGVSIPLQNKQTKASRVSHQLYKRNKGSKGGHPAQ